jgi:hypothetical protein
MFWAKFVQQIRTHILCSVIIHENGAHLWDNVNKKLVEADRS